MATRIHHVRDRSALDRALPTIEACNLLAVDTESNSMHAYQEQVCYVQLRAGDDIFLIDTVALRDLDPLVSIFADPNRVTILHGADYDVVCMARDFGIRFGNIFDTMLASQLLDKPGLGLAALCFEYFEVELDKSLTKYNWGQRPLEDKYVKYLVEDVAYLYEIRDYLVTAVEAADLMEEVEIEFRRTADLQGKVRVVDPEGYRKIKGARQLDVGSAGVLKALYLVRERIAEAENLPPFKVANSQALLALSRVKKASASQIAKQRAFRPRIWRTYEEEIVEAVRQGLTGEIKPVAPEKKPRMPKEIGLCNDELREWRKKPAEEREVPRLVILPNHAINEILEHRPKTKEELALLKGLGSKRIQLYGDAILEITNRLL
ncbi:MAG: ribonuclease D [Planctomycetota bacterium]|jgi:ribonuclease D